MSFFTLEPQPKPQIGFLESLSEPDVSLRFRRFRQEHPDFRPLVGWQELHGESVPNAIAQVAFDRWIRALRPRQQCFQLTDRRCAVCVRDPHVCSGAGHRGPGDVDVKHGDVAGPIAAVSCIQGVFRHRLRSTQDIEPRLGLPVELGWHRVGIATLFDIAVPYPMLDGPWPDTPHFLAVGIGTAAILALSFLLPPRFLPARYFLRFVAAIQTVSLGFFFFATPPFPYPLPGYLGGLLTVGMAVLALVPIALGFGFYIFDHSLGRQILITVLIVGHLAILLPLQGLIHAWLIHHLSLVVQPTLFFVFGLLVEVLVFVALYGWAMSWSGSEIAAGGAPR